MKSPLLPWLEKQPSWMRMPKPFHLAFLMMVCWWLSIWFVIRLRILIYGFKVEPLRRWAPWPIGRAMRVIWPRKLRMTVIILLVEKWLRAMRKSFLRDRRRMQRWLQPPQETLDQRRNKMLFKNSIAWLVLKKSNMRSRKWSTWWNSTRNESPVARLLKSKPCMLPLWEILVQGKRLWPVCWDKCSLMRVFSQGKNSVSWKQRSPIWSLRILEEQLNRPKPCLKKREEASSLLMKPIAWIKKIAVQILGSRRSIPSSNLWRTIVTTSWLSLPAIPRKWRSS